MALMVGIGAGGALITQYLDIKNVQEKIGKRKDIDKKSEYLTKVIGKKQGEKGYLRDRARVQLMPWGQAVAVDREVLDQMTKSESKQISERANKYLNVQVESLIKSIGLNPTIY